MVLKVFIGYYTDFAFYNYCCWLIYFDYIYVVLICIDIFNGIKVPEPVLTQQFLSQVRNCLNENGEILFNFVAHNYESKKKTKEIEIMLLSLFSNQETFKIEGINRVFHCVK